MDSVTRWEALHRLRVAADAALAEWAARAHAGGVPDYGVIAALNAPLVTAMWNAVHAGIPVHAAFEAVFGRADYTAVRTIVGGVIADIRSAEAQRALADVSAIPLPERFPEPDEGGADAGGVGAGARAAIPLPERFPEPVETVAQVDVGAASDCDVQAIRDAEETLGATFTESERRIAARAVNRLRVYAERARANGRAARRRVSLLPVRMVRPVHAARRAPRRKTHRVRAPCRAGPQDGPTPGEPPSRTSLPRERGRASGGVS